MPLDPLILDACCVLNLGASGEMHAILKILPFQFLIGSRAAESQWLKTDVSGEREEMDLAPLMSAGLLRQQSLDGSIETELFVELSRQMEDGEADAAALAISRGYALATDERKVRRILGMAYPSLKLFSTAELLYEWQFRARISNDSCAEILRRVSFRASFVPPRMDSRREWWLRLSQLDAES